MHTLINHSGSSDVRTPAPCVVSMELYLGWVTKESWRQVVVAPGLVCLFVSLFEF